MADELTWQAILVQAIPVLGGALAALLGALPGYFKDKRELAARERLAAEERAASRENERQAKTYDERKNAYIDFISSVRSVVAELPNGEYAEKMDIANISYSTTLLFCSDDVEIVTKETMRALREMLADFMNTKKYNEILFKSYMDAYGLMILAMRKDLAIHKTELC